MGMQRTLYNQCPFEVVSAMQKFIRRGDERNAMLCACELGQTSKNYAKWVTNRIEIISHEDIGLADWHAVTFVAVAIEQATRFYDSENLGNWRMMVGNAIMLLCRANKSREADHFQAATGLKALENRTPTAVPDYALDMHTRKGRDMGRGLEHFRTIGAQLVPAPTPDEYESEAYRVWAAIKERQAAAAAVPNVSSTPTKSKQAQVNDELNSTGGSASLF